MSNTVSRIAQNTAETILAAFAGQTVHEDEVYNQIEMQYALSNKRTTMGSYAQVLGWINDKGAKSHYTGPNCTGDHLYVFP